MYLYDIIPIPALDFITIVGYKNQMLKLAVLKSGLLNDLIKNTIKSPSYPKKLN